MKKLNISIGMTLFNEAGNIGKALRSLLAQKEDIYEIGEVIIVLDDCTDDTLSKIKEFGDKRVKIINNLKRSGKPTSLNTIFKDFNGDVLVIIDGDMTLRGEDSLSNLVKPFIKDPKMAMVFGNSQPIEGKTLIGKAGFNFYMARNKYSKEFDYKNSAYPAHAYLAYANTFFKNFTLPKNILNDDAYSYFYCKKNNLKSKYCENSIANFLPPQNAKDRVSQYSRYIKGRQQLEEVFGFELVSEKYFVPKRILIKIMIYQLVKNPLGYICLKLVSLYSLYRARFLVLSILTTWHKVNVTVGA